MNCVEILKEFIERVDIDMTSMNYANQRIENFFDIYDDINFLEYDDEVLNKILIDVFNVNSENLKIITDKFVKKGVTIGRRHKKVLLKYLNYAELKDLEKFIHLIEIDNKNLDKEAKNELVEFINKNKQDLSKTARTLFVNLWRKAEESKDTVKMGDYLFSIFSRIHKYYAHSSIGIVDLLNYNKKFINNDLTKDSIRLLEERCKESIDIDDEEIVPTFYKEYTSLLLKELKEKSLSGQLENNMNQDIYDENLNDEKYIFDRGNDLALIETESFNSIYLTLNQEVFDSFGDLNKFYDYVIKTISNAYRILENNKVLGIQIDNIYYNNKNIKWDLYGYIGVYSERFIKIEETGNFYKPELLCLDMMSKYNIKIKDLDIVGELEKRLKTFYKGKGKIEKVYELCDTDLSLDRFEEYVKQWKYVYYGFSFNDCIILRNIKDEHERELKFIKNDNSLLFIMYKYRIDQRKVPCPVCGGLNVVGNSYPEVGHRSWECKNIICSKRSKSNRGKRFSFKSNYMQMGAANPIQDNFIEKDFIQNWRKDIVTVKTNIDVYAMFIRYFTFAEEKILFINSDINCIKTAEEKYRYVTLLSLLNKNEKTYESKVKITLPEENGFLKYFNQGEFVSRFIIDKPINSNLNYQEKLIKFLNEQDSQVKIIKGDCWQVLSNFPEGIVGSAVTSPPYYNARDYSQWPNLYLYLIDIFNIVKTIKRVLKKGGIFLYNIGDINGNENIVARSTMGNKRMLLGAYSILVFKAAGFELVENIIWDKGEPQSKRNTNDGNFTPHYQKPINAYEHMFIFKKVEDEININVTQINKSWNENIVSFSPVIKINSKGENTLGHTAPFPKDIPDFVSKTFSDIGDIILDPFLGSGTSAIAAAENKRLGLGIELLDEYVDLSSNRIIEEGLSLDILKLN